MYVNFYVLFFHITQFQKNLFIFFPRGNENSIVPEDHNIEADLEHSIQKLFMHTWYMALELWNIPYMGENILIL